MFWKIAGRFLPFFFWFTCQGPHLPRLKAVGRHSKSYKKPENWAELAILIREK
jgi:hypothetical protein